MIDYEAAKREVESNPTGHSDEAKDAVIAVAGESEYRRMLHAAGGSVRVGITPDPTGTRKTFTIGTLYSGGSYVEREPTTTSYPPPTTDHGTFRPASGERFVESYSGPQIRNDAPTAAPTTPQPQANAAAAEAKFQRDPLSLTRDDVAALKAKWGDAEYQRRAREYVMASNRKITVR